MLKTINKNNINNLFKNQCKKDEKCRYKIEQTKNNIKIFNNKESILLYYLNDYIDNSKDIDNAIDKIEKDIGSYGNCDSKEENSFWKNLNQCIIIYPNNLEDNIKKFINDENLLIMFINEYNI